MCYQTYPAKHLVKNTETGESCIMCGGNIFCMLRDDGLSHPTFDKYAEHVRRRDHPTPEEIAEAAETRRRIEKESQKRLEKSRELEAITNKYKASSRL